MCTTGEHGNERKEREKKELEHVHTQKSGYRLFGIGIDRYDLIPGGSVR